MSQTTAGVGHNSAKSEVGGGVERSETSPAASGASKGGIAAERLRSIVDRIERLEDEKAALSSDVKDIYKEAKSGGFDTKALRELIKIRKRDATAQEELETILDTYRHALGMG